MPRHWPSEVGAEEARLHAMLETLQRKGGRAADRARLLRRQWQAVVYNVAIQGRPSMALPPLASARPWAEIVAGALKQTDVHLHELVVYARRDAHGLPDERLRQCADRALSLFEAGGKWGF